MDGCYSGCCGKSGAVFGFEHELNISSNLSQEQRPSGYCCPVVDNILYSGRLNTTRNRFGTTYGSGRFWLLNGGGFYSDCSHLEYTSAECSRLDELVANIHAGYRIAARLVQAYDAAFLPDHQHTVLANGDDHFETAGRNIKTFGTHENYSLQWRQRRFLSKETFRPIVSFPDNLRLFFASRYIYSRGGFIPPQGSRSYKNPFYLSEKPSHYHSMLGVSPEAIGDGTGPRLELKTGEANFSPVAIKLKFGMTALAMKLNLDGVDPLEGWGLNERYYSAYIKQFTLNLVGNPDRINNDEFRVGIGECRQRSALEVQEAYLDAMERYRSSGDADVIWTLDTARKTLDTLKKDPMGADWLDWVIKYKWLKRMKALSASLGIYTQDDLVRFDRSYHACDPKINVYRLVAGYPLPEREITKAMFTPPQTTRAKYRGEAVGLLLQAVLQSAEKGGGIRADIGWSRASIGETIFPMDNPLI